MAFDFSVTGNTKLDTSGFTQGVSSMTVAAGTLIADLVKTASSQLTNLAQSAIRNGSVYETSLAKVGTIADLGKLSIQKLGSQITDMSNTMGIAATDIAEATYQAISAGQDTANAVEFAGQGSETGNRRFYLHNLRRGYPDHCPERLRLERRPGDPCFGCAADHPEPGQNQRGRTFVQHGPCHPAGGCLQRQRRKPVQWSSRDDRQRYRHCRGNYLHKIHAERAGRHRLYRRQDLAG